MRSLSALPTSLAVLTGAALGLRLFHLTRFELFVDEAATWWFARLAAEGRIAEQMSLEPTPPLYYGLIGVLMRLFGEADWVLRLPSAVFGAAAVPAVFFLGRRLFDGRVGGIAAVLLAFHPLHVFYSREARVYPLLLLLTLATLLALWRALERGAWRDWGLFSGVLVVTCYSHFYGMFLIVATGLVVVFLARGRNRWRGLAALAVAGLVFAPYLLATLPQLRESGAAWSIETFYRDFPRELTPGRVLEAQMIGAGYHPYLRQLDRPPTPTLLRFLSVAAQLALLALAVRTGLRRGKSRELAFLLLAWLVPVLIPWAITIAGRAIFHAGRHDVYVLGTLCVLLAIGLETLLFRRPATWRLAGRAIAVATIAALVWGAAFRLVALHQVPASRYHRTAGQWLARHAGPDDRVVTMGIRRLVTQHYANLAGGRTRFASFPRDTDDHPGWSDVMTLMNDQEALHQEARMRVAALEREMPEGATLFLALRDYERTEDAVSATWLVDRHLLENLWRAGWRKVPELSLEDAQIEAYRRPNRGG